MSVRTTPFALALLALASRAPAHGVHQREGSARLQADRLVTTIACDAGHERRLLDALVIRDAEGVRLRGRVLSSTAPEPDGHVLATLEHAFTAPPRWLSFQLVPPEPARALAERLRLTVDDSAHAQVVDLTSGGNVEALRFPRLQAADGCGPAILDAPDERLHAVQALLRLDAPAPRLDVVLPLGLLESWAPVARADADFLSAAEQDAARAGILDVVRSRIILRHGDRRVVTGPGDIDFLGLDDPATGPAPAPRRLGAWTARVRVSMSVGGAETLEWGLFNALVLTGRVVVVRDGSCDVRRVSTLETTIPLHSIGSR